MNFNLHQWERFTNTCSSASFNLSTFIIIANINTDTNHCIFLSAASKQKASYSSKLDNNDLEANDTAKTFRVESLVWQPL